MTATIEDRIDGMTGLAATEVEQDSAMAERVKRKTSLWSAHAYAGIPFEGRPTRSGRRGGAVVQYAARERTIMVHHG